MWHTYCLKILKEPKILKMRRLKRFINLILSITGYTYLFFFLINVTIGFLPVRFIDPPPNGRGAMLETYIRKQMQFADTKGVIHFQFKDGPSQFVSTETDMSEDTLFLLGSISKQITGLMILKLVQQGKLSLTDTPCMHLKIRFKDNCADPKSWGNTSSIHELLNHKSGISRNGPNKLLSFGFALLHLISSRDLSFSQKNYLLKQTLQMEGDTNSSFLYSNHGYFILSRIIESNTGVSFGTASKNLVFDPIKMDHSLCIDENTHEDDLRAAYPRTHKFGIGRLNFPYRIGSLTHTESLGGGSCLSTVNDLLKLIDFLKHNQTEHWLAPIFDTKVDDYALGWMHKSNHFWHYGANLGAYTQVSWSPTTNAHMIYLSPMDPMDSISEFWVNALSELENTLYE